MSLGTTLITSFLITLARPATWPVALSAFLIRGGIVLVVAPIVVLPSAVGLGNVAAPIITNIALGTVTPVVVAVVAGTTAAVLIWIIAGGVFTAIVELELTEMVAADEDLVAISGTWRSARSSRIGRVGRVAIVRLIAHVPTVLALAWGGVRIVEAAYRELTVPSDVTIPIVVRALSGAPTGLAVIVIAWTAGEIVGSVASRRVILADRGIARALGTAIVTLVRYPIRCIVMFLVPTGALLAVVLPSALAASAGLTAVRETLAGDPDGATLLVLVAFVALWVGSLVLIGAVASWRAATWTVDAAGTFGAGATRREGDWNHASGSGTLGSPRPRGADPDSR